MVYQFANFKKAEEKAKIDLNFLMMNKSIVYIVLAAIVGLGLGYVLFNAAEEQQNTAEESHNHEDATQMWTCSMHPQIMREEPGDCPICGMDLIPAESSSDGLTANQFKMTENALALANIQTTVVGNSNAASEALTLSGKIAVNEDETATQPAHFDGRIERLLVSSVGQEVRKGQEVATIYSPELVAAQQELFTAAKLKGSQPKLYTAVRNKFKNWMISDALLDQIEETGKTVTRFPIYASFSGVVSEISVNEGAHVMDGNPIFKVADLSTVWAEFDAYENQINQLKKGQSIRISSNAYPNKIFDAKISFIDPVLNTQTRTVTVRVTFNNAEDLLKPGMFVEAKVKGATVANTGLMIPASAVMWTGERSLVYVKPNANASVFEMREVTLGEKIGDSYSIVSGLSKGEEIVTNGTFTVDAAAQLSGKKSMMNATSETTSDEATVAMKMQFSKDFQSQLKKVVPNYLTLKDAFVASEVEQISSAAANLQVELQSVENQDLNGMVKSHFDMIQQNLEVIVTSDTLEEQRAAFVILNENMVVLVNNISGIALDLYVQRCPMANNSKGAVWLSSSSEIRNPYYGDAMLTCGSVIDTLGL